MHIRSLLTRRRSSALAAGVGLLALTAPPAVAEELVVRDGRGDMWIIEEGSTDPSPAPRHEVGDIRRTRYLHTDSRIVVRVKFEELRPRGKRFVLWSELEDRAGAKTYVGVEARRRYREGRTTMFADSGKDVDCKVNHRIDYDADVVRLGFARACVGDPRSLRFRTFDELTARDWSYAYLDDAHDRRMSFTWSARVRSGEPTGG